MIETILIALLICKIKGYKISPLFKSYTIYPVIFFEIIYLFVQANIFLENYEVIKYVGLLKSLYLCSYLPMIFKYNLYIKSIIGSVFVILGGKLNDIAIKANDGFMPVFPKLSYITGYATVESFNKVEDIHILGSEITKLKYLTDIFDIGYSILSIGDIFIRLFVFIIIYGSIKTLQSNEEIKVNKGETKCYN